jgi:23S rRNA pseudouridine1911/1915/1917 synthase
MPRRAPRRGKRRPPDLSRPLDRWVLEVGPPDDGRRLDTFLAARLHWRSRTAVQQLIRDGRVERAGRPGRPGERVRAGDTVTLAVAATDAPPPDASAIPLEVLYEDRWLVALNKQPGVLVHPVGRHRTNTLIAALHARYRRDGADDRVPKLCHRLDRDTSGAWVVALDDRVRARLGADFAGRRVQKEYRALVRGVVADDAQAVRLAIGHDPDSPVRLKRRAGPGADAQPAWTDVRVLERFAHATLVACVPRTGRTHQIRVHLDGIGHPILGDPLYGPQARPEQWTAPGHGCAPLRDAAGALVLDRHALHAARVAFTHPITGAPIAVEAPLPPDLARCIAWLRGGARP